MNRLFVILNPLDYKKHKSYLQHWTGPSPFTLTKVKEVGSVLSALAVSKCGKYLAIGSMTTGDVDIYVSFSLQVSFLFSKIAIDVLVRFVRYLT